MKPLTHTRRPSLVLGSSFAVLLLALSCGKLNERDFAGPPSDGGGEGGADGDSDGSAGGRANSGGTNSGGGAGESGSGGGSGGSFDSDCGNDVVEGQEECDETSDPCAPDTSCQICNRDCEWETVTGPTCGDRNVDDEEDCDEAPKTRCDYGRTCQSCTEDCVWESILGPYCGDETVNGDEDCDEAPLEDCAYGATCQSCADCAWEPVVGPYCGDGEVNGAEECDEESAPCPSGMTCTICNANCEEATVDGPYCGDGEVNGAEECDGSDDCTIDCRRVPETCNPAGTECGERHYCQASSCSTTGTCALRPSTTSFLHQPACGCNGTTYWNATHARYLGAMAFATGSTSGCGIAGTPSAKRCSSGNPCTANGASCVIDGAYGNDACNLTANGVCWAKPTNATCAGGLSNPDVGFIACDGSTPSCVDICVARLIGNNRVSCL